MIGEHLAEFMDHDTQLIVSNVIIDISGEVQHYRSLSLGIRNKYH